MQYGIWYFFLGVLELKESVINSAEIQLFAFDLGLPTMTRFYRTLDGSMFVFLGEQGEVGTFISMEWSGNLVLKISQLARYSEPSSQVLLRVQNGG